MNLENISRFRRILRPFGGNIFSKTLQRESLGHKWMSSFAALSFTFFSAFPALPMETVSVSTASTQEQGVEGEKKALSPEVCDFKRDLREISQVTDEMAKQEQERPCHDTQGTASQSVVDPGVKENLEKQLAIEEVTKGSPLYDMAPYIARFDKSIAGLLVGIAKKESSFGEHSPSKAGEDCYNYWGYKGEGGRGTSMGYACFSSREEAVGMVGDRLLRLTEKRSSTEPSHLVTSWKCGSSCAGHSKESVSKWVSDVQKYYSQIAYSK